MTVHFTTNNDWRNWLGFMANYSIEPLPSGCGGDLYATSDWQEVVSPGYPDVYIAGLFCTWTIHAPPGNNVRIRLEEKSMPYDPDRVMVHSRALNPGTRLFWNTQPWGLSTYSDFVSDTSIMILQLYGRMYGAYPHSKGFLANYTLDTDYCYSSPCQHRGICRNMEEGTFR